MEIRQNYADWESELPMLYISLPHLPPNINKKAASKAITADLLPVEWTDQIKAMREQELYLIRRRKAMVGEFKAMLNSSYPDLDPAEYLKQHHPELFI